VKTATASFNNISGHMTEMYQQKRKKKAGDCSSALRLLRRASKQAFTRGGEAPPRKFSDPPLEKCVGHILKMLDI